MPPHPKPGALLCGLPRSLLSEMARECFGGEPTIWPYRRPNVEHALVLTEHEVKSTAWPSHHHLSQQPSQASKRNKHEPFSEGLRPDSPTEPTSASDLHHPRPSSCPQPRSSSCRMVKRAPQMSEIFCPAFRALCLQIEARTFPPRRRFLALWSPPGLACTVIELHPENGRSPPH